MTLRYFAQTPANRDRLGGLQLLGRLAALLEVTVQVPALALLPGTKPALRTVAVDHKAGTVTVELIDAETAEP